MKLNLLFLNANATRPDDQKMYVSDVKKSLSIEKGCGKDSQCVAHFLYGAEITAQKVGEMIKKKGITKITFKGVGSDKTGQLSKALQTRFTNKCFTLNADGNILTITAKESINIEKSEKLAVA